MNNVFLTFFITTFGYNRSPKKIIIKLELYLGHEKRLLF